MKLTDKAISLKMTQEMLDTSLVSAGNTARLAKVMKRAAAGESITVSAIGGSVTVGGCASSKPQGYAGLMRIWWEQNFPQTEIQYVNAGYSGTSSLFGVHRVEQFLLRHDPDFVVVEFCVNDIIHPYQIEAYASLVRRILTHPTEPAVILLFLTNEGGVNAQADQQPIGVHYDLPMISYRDAVMPHIRTEENPDALYAWRDVCADWVHPTDMGHAITAEFLCSYLTQVKEQLDTLSTDEPALPEPPLPYVYENAKWLHCDNTTPVSMGSFEVFTKGNCCWKSNGGSDPLVIAFEGKRAIVTICTENMQQGIDVSIRIDGGEIKPLGDYVFHGGAFANYPVFDAAEAGAHTIEIIPNGCEVYCGGLFIS